MHEDLIASLKSLDGFAILERGITALENNDFERASYIAARPPKPLP